MAIKIKLIQIERTLRIFTIPFFQIFGNFLNFLRSVRKLNDLALKRTKNICYEMVVSLLGID